MKKKSIFKRLLPYAGRKSIMLYAAMFFSALSGIAMLMPMVYIHKIVSGIILSGEVDSALVRRYAISAAVFAASGLIVYGGSLLLSHLFAFEVEKNIIKESFKKLMSKPLGFFTNRESGKLRGIIVDGAAETHSFLAHQLPDLAMTMVTPIILLIFFFFFDWRLGLVSAIPILIGLLLMSFMMTKKAKVNRDEYFLGLSNLSSEAVEYVRGIPVVKTFAQSVESFDRLYSLIINMKNTVMEMTMSYKNKMALFEATSASTAFFLVPAAILFISSGGDMRIVLGNSVIYLLIGPAFGVFIMRSATINQYMYFAELALNKIDEILDYEELSYGEKYGDDSGLEFRNVEFSYAGDKVIDGISFNVKKGETVALVGTSGAGKTTIARLAARFWDVDSGEVLIGGINVKNYDQAALMRKIAFVFQRSDLFKMSIKENLLLGNPHADHAQIDEALVKSGAKEIIENLENGLDTVYGSKGTYFSGGETQRIAIARALLKDAELVILDEATAFADPENEHIIQASFKELAKDKTTLMIAHRLTTVADADRILVIDNGKIAESGRHDELLAQGGVYKKLWDEYQRAANWRIGGRDE